MKWLGILVLDIDGGLNEICTVCVCLHNAQVLIMSMYLLANIPHIQIFSNFC